MQVLISGDIYLKKEPIYEEYSFSEIEEMQMEKAMMLAAIEETRSEIEKRLSKSSDISEETKEKFLIGANGELDKQIEELNEKETNMIEKGKPNYDEYKNFWVLLCTDTGLQMFEQTNKGQGKIRKYPNKEEMDKDFISLRELLVNAQYFGREFIVPEKAGDLLIVSIGNTGSENPSGFIATYFVGDRAIIFNKKTNKFELAIDQEILSTTMGQLPFDHEEYRDRSELYKAIFKQLANGNKKKL